MKYSNICRATLLGALMLVPIGAMAKITLIPTPKVISFTVVNADTGTDIATFASSGKIAILDTPNINIRANVTGARSVIFTDDKTYY